MEMSRRFETAPAGAKFPVTIAGDVGRDDDELSVAAQQPVALGQHANGVGDVFDDVVQDHGVVRAGQFLNRLGVDSQAEMFASDGDGAFVNLLAFNIPAAVAELNQPLTVAAPDVEEFSGWRLVQAHQRKPLTFAADGCEIEQLTIPSAGE